MPLVSLCRSTWTPANIVERVESIRYVYLVFCQKQATPTLSLTCSKTRQELTSILLKIRTEGRYERAACSRVDIQRVRKVPQTTRNSGESPGSLAVGGRPAVVADVSKSIVLSKRGFVGTCSISCRTCTYGSHLISTQARSRRPHPPRELLTLV